MNYLNNFYNKLTQLGYDFNIIFKHYTEPHRYYHNLNHIFNLIKKGESFMTDDLFIAIVFHDIIYDPLKNDNEEKSAELYKQISSNYNIDIHQAILETKTHEFSNSKISDELCKLDLDILKSNNLSELITFEKAIFKEYQFVDYSIYKEKRLEILQSLNANSLLIDYVKLYQPKIAIYPGSFNPFHKGHLNILEKAEKIFDKVIIAQGINHDKKQPEPLTDFLKYRQKILYTGLLTDCINSLNYPVTVIRGLRNSKDYEEEKIMLQYLKDLKSNINIVYIQCDKEYEHISSSAIRNLNNYSYDKKLYTL